MFHTKYSTYASGALFCVRPGVHFQLIKEITNPEGRFMMVIGHLEEIDSMLLNIYAHNVNQVGFMESLTPNG